jgi:hypothetical protein
MDGNHQDQSNYAGLVPELKRVLKSPELREMILKCLSCPRDLAAFEATCKEFRGYAGPIWDDFGKLKFGVSVTAGDNKKGLRRAAAVTGKGSPHIRFDIKEHFEFGVGLDSDSWRMACGSGYLVIRNDHNYGDRESEESDITYRDAGTLSFVKSDPIELADSVAVCGKQGMEIIVTSHFLEDEVTLARRCWLTAYRGGRRWRFNPQGFERVRVGARGIQLLGSESQLVAVTRDSIFLFTPNYDPSDSAPLLILQEASNVGGNGNLRADIRWSTEVASRTLPAGGAEKFGILTDNSDEDEVLSIWQAGEATVTKTIKQIHFDFSLRAYAFSERFVVASGYDNKIHIFDYNTSAPVAMCNDNDILKSRYHYFDHLEIIENSDILVSSSIEDDGLCIWNMQTGNLFKRYFRPVNHYTPRSMMRLPHLPLTFITLHEDAMTVWSFPLDERTREVIQSIARRETALNTQAELHVD